MSDHSNENQEVSGANESGQDTQAHSARQTPALIEKFVIRLPKGLRNKIKHLSEQNRRSMNSEIIMVLEKHIQQNLSDQELVDELVSRTQSSLDSAPESAGGDQPADSELAKRLQNLPEEKKQALLELLG